MEDSHQSVIPLLACVVSLAATVPIVLSRNRPNLRESWTFLASLVKLGLVVALIPAVLQGETPEFRLWEIFPGLSIAFRVDGLGLLFALVASTLWIATSCYSVGYMRGLNEHAQTRFYVFFAIAIFATIGVAFAANLVTLYLFYEILSLSTFPLVAHHQDPEARTGGRTYISYLLSTSIGLALPAMIYVYVKSGGAMDFSEGGFLAGKISAKEATVLLLLFVFGFAKAGLMPLHSWLPSAMVAPTPVSALLHAVAVVKVGVFCIVRVFTGVFGVDFLAAISVGEVVTWISAFTVVVSSLIALTQDNLKRRLAFSTIGQLAYVIMGVSLLSPFGVVGSVMHIGMHAFGKITLFFCAGAIFVATGKTRVSEMSGIGRKMPWTMLAFFLASLSIIGLPPFGGAWSKWFLFIGALEAKSSIVVVVLMVSSLLNIAYLLPVVARAFYLDPVEGDAEEDISEAPFACVLPLTVTGFACFFLFLFPGVMIDLADLIGGCS